MALSDVEIPSASSSVSSREEADDPTQNFGRGAQEGEEREDAERTEDPPNHWRKARAARRCFCSRHSASPQLHLMS